MSQIRNTHKIIITLFVFAAMAIGGGCKTVEQPEQPPPLQQTQSPLISEFSPVSSDQEPAWIELYNPLARKVDVTGLTIVVNDSFQYTLPDEVSTMPARGRLVIILGKEKALAAIKRQDDLSIVYTDSALQDAMKPRKGQLALYRQGKAGQKVLTDFVSWGAPASLKSLSPERHRIWQKQWYVRQAPSFGDYDENMLTQARNFSIGRHPGSTGRQLSDWQVYFGNERTPGADNAVPGVGLFTLSDNAVVRSEDISIGWTSNKFVKQFQFQISRDASFRDLVEDVKLNTPVYKPKSILPEGKYYYRVRALDARERVSDWSKTMSINSKRMRPARSNENEDGAITQEVLLNAMQFKHQKKDTQLLCLDSCPSHLDGATVKHWDNVHPEAVPVNGDHGDMNCVRASISMMVSFYGRTLSQDRIAYFTQEERAGVGNGIPEGDLAHGDGMSYSAEETAALEWALDETITDFVDTPNPSFNDLKGWLDNNRPIMTRRPGHLRAMNGYREEDDGTQWVHIMDPWSGERWETYATWNATARGTWVGPVSAPNAREDEPEIWTDADNDGVMDFDEQIRFHTGSFDADADNDDVVDKPDIYEYVFQNVNYAKRSADFDTDGVRKENDPDNDADTFNDGCEDVNGNGIFEAALGETDNFLANAGLVCGEKPNHAIIVFDRSGSMVYPPSDPVKKYDRAANAATLFLDTWLANDPPAQTRVGLVYYDHNAHYDTSAVADTTLDLLTEAKRDKIVNSFPLNLPDFGATSIGGGILKSTEADGFDVAGIPADDQHRLIMVLTDGKENAGVQMDDPLVTQTLVNGKIDGYVLGIGDESQIDEDKLTALAEILNHSPAALAKDLDAFQLEKFFLQVLAESQGMEFALDPLETINLGQTKTHGIAVNPGAQRVTFVVVWNERNAKLAFSLQNPAGQTVTADVTKFHDRYQVSSKVAPTPGQWQLTVTASSTGSPAPGIVHYSIMALEKNTTISAQFQVQAVHYLTGDRLRLVASLSKERKAMKNGQVTVKVDRPKIGLGTFTSREQVQIPDRMVATEKGAVLTPADKKYLIMAQRKIKVPSVSQTIILTDDGKNGDEIPGDGKYSAIFDQTQNDGIYSFRFIAKSQQEDKVSALNREKVITVYVRPRIKPARSMLEVLDRKYLEASKQTLLTLTVTPKDAFGNLVGPGNADLLRFDTSGKISKVVDKLDGSYDVVLTIPGDYIGKPGVRPEFRRLGTTLRRITR